MMASNINGFSVAYTVAGAILLWSGITGNSLSDTFRTILSGKVPTQAPAPATSSSPASASVPAANAASENTTGSGNTANQAIGALLAAPYGWGPGTTNWTDLVSLWTRESSWNNTATNPTSGAYGIAQALGHGTAGTAGTVTNEYGGYGVSDAVAQDANSGSASAQITWGLAYIKETYGSPSAAWAEEESAGAY